jgi:hypothetical protein
VIESGLNLDELLQKVLRNVNVKGDYDDVEERNRGAVS